MGNLCTTQKLVCPECKRLGQTPTGFTGGDSGHVTLMDSVQTYDKYGNMNPKPKINTLTKSYNCSFGHTFETYEKCE